MIECPNHGGNFDCTPFCERCGGEQEFEVHLYFNGHPFPEILLCKDLANCRHTGACDPDRKVHK
jgi:hypothetical protein